jgi:hypothetical protein
VLNGRRFIEGGCACIRPSKVTHCTAAHSTNAEQRAIWHAHTIQCSVSAAVHLPVCAVDVTCKVLVRPTRHPALLRRVSKSIYNGLGHNLIIPSQAIAFAPPFFVFVMVNAQSPETRTCCLFIPSKFEKMSLYQRWGWGVKGTLFRNFHPLPPCGTPMGVLP